MTTLIEVPAIVTRAFRTGTNLHLTGEPGLGKTSVIEQTVAALQKEYPDFGFWNIYTPALSPIDFSVPMPDQETGTLRMYHNDRLPNAFVNPGLKGIVFLGERDNADPATNKALQKYINNEDMGGLRKPAGVIVVSDSNSLAHRSGVVQQSLALLSRSRVVDVKVDAEATLKYFAQRSVNVYVQAYLSLRKEHVSTFDILMKNREYGVWANPRAWERLAKALTDAEDHSEVLSHEEIIGDVGEAVGQEFIGFLRAAKDLVSYAEIVDTPTSAAIPDKMSDVYAVIAMLAASSKPEDMDPIRAYVERFGIEVQVLYLRMLLTSKGKHAHQCVATKAHSEWFSNPELSSAILGS